jgi:hypothetical protein
MVMSKYIAQLAVQDSGRFAYLLQRITFLVETHWQHRRRGTKGRRRVESRSLLRAGVWGRNRFRCLHHSAKVQGLVFQSEESQTKKKPLEH